MSSKRTVAVIAVVLLAGAFLAGYLPQRNLRKAAEQEAHGVRQQLADAEARVKMAHLLGQTLALRDLVVRQNYGQAQALSSSFFNEVRAEATATPRGDFREVLNGVLSQRDSVTASLTKADTTVTATLHEIEVQIRRAAGYSVPPEG